MDINHNTEARKPDEKVLTHFKASDKKRKPFMSLLEKQKLGLDDGPVITTKKAPRAERKPTTPPAQAVVESKPMPQEPGTITHSTPQPTARKEKPAVEPKQINTDPNAIVHNAQPAGVPQTKADSIVVTHDNPEEPHVAHERKPFTHTYTEPVRPDVDKTDPEDHIFTHSAPVKPQAKAQPTPIVEAPKPQPVVYQNEQPQQPAQPQRRLTARERLAAQKKDNGNTGLNAGAMVNGAQTTPTEVLTPTAYTVAALDALFVGDIAKIIKAIITNQLDFQKFPIQMVIPELSIIKGEEGIAQKTSENAFTLRTPTPAAIIYLVHTLLNVAYGMGFDKTKLTDMLIEMITMSDNVTEWLMMVNELWGELQANAR